MTKSRRRFSAEFKFEVALEAAKGLKTLNELSSQFGVHPNQVSDWKRELLESGSTVFSNPAARKAAGAGSAPGRALRADRTPEDGARMAEKKAARYD
jgi:transposase